jgi:uncharacterized flavoprotein (TIGR03862 family)
MAAEVLSHGGVQVDLFDSMPSVGRKFLLAGKGGLNLTHSEPLDAFLARYGSRREAIEPLLAAFDPAALVEWVRALGFEVFTGSSGRIFPLGMKAAPMLRAWLHRLRAAGVRFHLRHKWDGWNEDGSLRFETPGGTVAVAADATVLAAGGGSWPKLGSDAAWVSLLASRDVPIAPLRPANCGFDVEGGWSGHFREKWAGQPIKPVVLGFGASFRRQGEFVLTDTGIEGSLVYAASTALRDEIDATGSAVMHLDLLPDRDAERVLAEVGHPRGSRSMSSHLQSRTGLKGAKVGLLRELLSKEDFADPGRLAAAIKHLPVRLAAPRPLEESISTAGGVRFEDLDASLMVRLLPGTFCAGEMLDWEAPTGGYLLTACFASGRAAGHGALRWLGAQ